MLPAGRRGHVRHQQSSRGPRRLPWAQPGRGV